MVHQAPLSAVLDTFKNEKDVKLIAVPVFDGNDLMVFKTLLLCTNTISIVRMDSTIGQTAMISMKFLKTVWLNSERISVFIGAG